jgi:hypothetical protein
MRSVESSVVVSCGTLAKSDEGPPQSKTLRDLLTPQTASRLAASTRAEVHSWFRRLNCSDVANRERAYGPASTKSTMVCTRFMKRADENKTSADFNGGTANTPGRVQVRLIQSEERQRFDQIITQSHYLHSAEFVGEQLRYVAEYQGQWVALAVWSAAAYKLKLREQWIGWSDRQKRRRLPLVVNQSRVFIPPEFQIPNLASRVMKLNLERLALDWEQAYHHAVLIAETFVDPESFRGTTYKASGWTLLGHTQGFGRSRADFYEPHDKPKQLWVRELQPGARTIRPDAWAPG